MATYNASKQAAGIEPKYLQAGLIAVSSVFALTAAFGLADLVNMVTVPSGATIIDTILSSDTALDTNATSTISYDVGDSNAAQRYVAAKAQGNDLPLAPYHMDQAPGHQYKTGTNAGDTTLVVKIHAAPATGAATGNLRLTVLYSMDA